MARFNCCKIHSISDTVSNKKAIFSGNEKYFTSFYFTCIGFHAVSFEFRIAFYLFYLLACFFQIIYELNIVESLLHRIFSGFLTPDSINRIKSGPIMWSLEWQTEITEKSYRDSDEMCLPGSVVSSCLSSSGKFAVSSWKSLTDSVNQTKKSSLFLPVKPIIL